MNRLEELKSLIEYHDNLYYNQDEPEIEDWEYDNLVKEYLSLGGSFDDIAKGEASSKFEKVKHIFPIKSLDKIHTEEEVREALIRYAPGVIQPKLDGLTIVVYGQGVKSPYYSYYATKGTGGTGECVNYTCSRIDKLILVDNLAYRAEIFMPISKFKEINARRIAQGLEPFKNPRNAAAGMVRNSNADKVEGLTYMAYNILGTTQKETEQLEMLKRCGVITVPSLPYTEKNIDQAVKFIMDYNNTYRDKLDYEIDGLVIKSNAENAINTFGETGHHFKNAVAFKFPGEGKWTKLKNVVWQVGRTGAVSPVAEFEPIDILGSTITRATLHNYDNITKLGLTDDCEVFVIKANDVIPKIIDCRNRKGKPICMMLNCPECGSAAFKKGANIYCSNAECKAMYISRTVHFTKKEALNIEDLSTKTVEKMFEIGVLKNPHDLFKLTVDDILKVEGFAKKSADKLYKNIQGARKVPLDNFLYAVGIPLVGRTVSKDIANKLYTFPAVIADITADSCKEIKSIPGIGKEILRALCLNVKAFVDFSSYVTPIDIEKPTAPVSAGPKYTFVITGTLSTPRDTVKTNIEVLGHKVSGSVSSKTDYVIVGDNPGGTKYDKAIALGFKEQGKMIDENQLIEILNRSKGV